MTRSLLRGACAVLILSPLYVAFEAPRLAALAREDSPAWPPTVANRIFPGFVAYLLAMTFFNDHLFHRPSSRLRARGGNPDEASLLGGIALPSGASIISFVLVLVGGLSLFRMYIYAGLCFAISVYWCFKYRSILT